MQLRTRIAPTPSGYLHIGNAFDFILEWLLAHAAGGSVLLRIDDLDQPRVRPEYLEEIFAALHWLGLGYEEGPRNVVELKKEWSQQLRLPLYEEMLSRLTQSGRVYACRCSRKDLEENGAIGCGCQADDIPLAEPEVAWRFETKNADEVFIRDVRQEAQFVNVHAVNPNFVIRRKDGLPAYHIASLSDDAFYQINFIVRGQDLWESTATQLLLAQTLALNHFQEVTFLHHPLIAAPEGGKLSKSAGAASLKAARENGSSSAEIFGQFCAWMGLPFRAKNAAELLQQYLAVK